MLSSVNGILSRRILRLLGLALGISLFLPTPSIRAEGCLDLKMLGRAAAQIQDLEVRTSIFKIEELDTAVEEGKFPEKGLVTYLSEVLMPDKNHFFFSIADGIGDKSFPLQRGCDRGTIVQIPIAGRLSLFAIIDSSPDHLTLHPIKDTGSDGYGFLRLKRAGENRLEFVRRVRATYEENVEGKVSYYSAPVVAQGFITWGPKGTLGPLELSKETLAIITRYKVF